MCAYCPCNRAVGLPTKSRGRQPHFVRLIKELELRAAKYLGEAAFLRALEEQQGQGPQHQAQGLQLGPLSLSNAIGTSAASVISSGGSAAGIGTSSSTANAPNGAGRGGAASAITPVQPAVLPPYSSTALGLSPSVGPGMLLASSHALISNGLALASAATVAATINATSSGSWDFNGSLPHSDRAASLSFGGSGVGYSLLASSRGGAVSDGSGDLGALTAITGGGAASGVSGIALEIESDEGDDDVPVGSQLVCASDGVIWRTAESGGPMVTSDKCCIS